MYLSRYLKVFPYPEEPEYLLFYATKNSAMALVPKGDYACLQQGEIPADCAETLTELDMLVPDLAEERKEVCNMLVGINRLDPGLNVSIILGMGCNFSCLYCYEGSQKGNRTMTDATTAQLITFLKERYGARKKEQLTLDFYGGEPLLYVQRIMDIAVPLKRFVEERGGEFRFALVTNGSLLTRETVAKLLPAGLFGVKVTVDGPPDEHNRLRPFKSGRPSFNVIMNNVIACCDLVQIGFGGNYTRGNYQRVPELLDLIEGLGLSPEKLGNVQFHPAMQTSDAFTNPEFTGGCCSTNEPWLAEAVITVRDAVLRRGFRTPKLNPSPCMVDLDDALVIHYDGLIYKCVAMIGQEGYAAGDVLRGIGNYAEIYRLDHWRHHAPCRECEYLPLCFGGCRYMEFQRSGTMEKVDCRREFWEEVLEKTVLQDARYQADDAGAFVGKKRV